MRLIYSRHYDIGPPGVQRLHPFDTRKYSRAWSALGRQFGATLRKHTVRVPRPVSEQELLAVHAPDYLAQLRDSKYLARALEVPILRHVPAWLLDWLVLRPMRYATMGTLLAAEQALQSGLAVNLSGGYHHAEPAAAGGFCIYSDSALAVHHLRTMGKLTEHDRVAYIDLDAHQGNGVCHQFMSDSRVFIFDMYNASIYPCHDLAALERIDCQVPLPPRCTGSEYLYALRKRLPGFIQSLHLSKQVRLAIYNAGTDVVAGDRLGGLSLTPEDVLQRDLFVIELLREMQIPTVIVPSGGYTRESYLMLAATAASLLERYGDAQRRH